VAPVADDAEHGIKIEMGGEMCRKLFIHIFLCRMPTCRALPAIEQFKEPAARSRFIEKAVEVGAEHLAIIAARSVVAAPDMSAVAPLDFDKRSRRACRSGDAHVDLVAFYANSGSGNHTA